MTKPHKAGYIGPRPSVLVWYTSNQAEAEAEPYADTAKSPNPKKGHDMGRITGYSKTRKQLTLFLSSSKDTHHVAE